MIAKEWRDARWKLLLGVLAFLMFLAAAPRSYETIIAQTKTQIEYAEKDLATPGLAGAPEEMRPLPDHEEQLRKELDELRSPGYPVKMAGGEMTDVHYGGNFIVLAPLAGLLGVALVSREVGRGSIFLLLAKPVSRTRALLTKYAICGASLFAVALIGVMATFASAYARGYPWAFFRVTEILISSFLFWLGSLSVLGLALLASVVFGDIIRSVVALIVVAYLIYAGPGLLLSLYMFWSFATGASPHDASGMDEPYMLFQRLYLLDYWTATDPFSGKWVATQNLIVCLVAAAVPLIASLWLFRRRAY